MSDDQRDIESTTGGDAGADAEFRRFIEEAAEEHRAGSGESAMLAIMRAMEVAAEAFEESDTEGDRLMKRRMELEEQCDWPAIIELQKEIIRYSENEQPQGQPDAPAHYAPAVACEPWRQLSAIYDVVGEHALALDAAVKAVEYARQSDLSPLRVMTLAGMANSLAHLDRMREARAAVEAALDAIDPELPFTDTLRSRYRLQLARYQARLHEVETARETLALVEPTLEHPQCQPDALKAAWFEVRAEIRAVEGNRSDAIDDLKTAVGLRKTAAQTFMGGEEYASARTAQTLGRLLQLQSADGLDADATDTRIQLETLCERFRFPVRAYAK